MALSPFNNKSSVLCPKTRHITSQYLALEQIEAHHKMISHAKRNIDMTAPKSEKSYISIIDRKKKNLWPSRTPLKHQSATSVNSIGGLHQRCKSRNSEEKNEMNGEITNTSMSLNKSIQAGFPFPTFNSKVADKISWYLEAVSQGEFQSTNSNQQNLQNENIHHYGSQTSLSNSLRSHKVIKGDLIEWHKHHFTSLQHSFSPRILVNNIAKSKIRDMRCYNPPKKKESDHTGESSNTFESYDVDNDDVEVEEEMIDKDDVEVVASSNEISMKDTDDDRNNWLSEQALRADIRRKFGNKYKCQPQRSNLLKNGIQATSKTCDSSNTVHTFSRDEEDNYLKFLNDVTEDILRSGVYSDRAIQQTFEFHLQFRPDHSDKEKLKQLMDHMLEGIRILSNETDDLSIKMDVDSIQYDDRMIIGAPLGKEDIDDKLKSLKNFNVEPSETLELDCRNISNPLVTIPHSDVENNVSEIVIKES